MTNCNAQNDPFGTTTSDKKEVTALSPSELPDFEEYRNNPEEVKIPSLLAKELAFILKEESKEKIAIIDARSKEEYDVSHINKSRRVGYEDFSIERIWMVSRDARVIVYSANKTRSTIVAQYFKLMGFSDVQVLEDGLIGWKNERNEIYDANGTTNKIHVGTKSNAKLVKSGLAVY
jgi:rhodanese-related sulfurtransferase